MAKKDDPNEPEPVTTKWEARLPLMFRLRGTVFLKIWWQILCVVLWSSAIVYCHMYVDGIRLNFPYVLIQLMGVVCGLLLVFRTNTAYDRYWEGRKTWSTMTQGIRTLTRAIWVNVKEENSRDIVEKKSAINLLVAFATATKHYLREEYSYDYDDLRNLIGHMHRFHTPSSVKPLERQSQQQQTQITVEDPPPPAPTTPLPPEDNDAATAKEGASKAGKGKDLTDKGKNIEMSIRKKKGKKGPKDQEDPEKGGITTDSEGEIKIKTKKKPKIVKAQSSTISIKSEKAYKWKAHDIATPTNIPIELSYYIASYINSLRVREKCDSGTSGAMSQALNSMMECLTTFERILRTPIPLAYSVHLHQSIWLYILALPFQLAGGPNGLEWWTVLIVGITSFFLLGILGIGWEIENPFGYDDNDLPLDDFCKVLRREIEVIVSQRPLNPQDWVFTEHNMPFAPECKLDAIVLSEKSVDEVMDIIEKRGSQINLNSSKLFTPIDDFSAVDGGGGGGRKRSSKKAAGRKISSDRYREDDETEKMIP